MGHPQPPFTLTPPHPALLTSVLDWLAPLSICPLRPPPPSRLPCLFFNAELAACPQPSLCLELAELAFTDAIPSAGNAASSWMCLVYLQGQFCPHFTPVCYSLHATQCPLMFYSAKSYLSVNTKVNITSSAAQAPATCSCVFSLIHTQAHCSHHSCLPSLSPYKASLCRRAKAPEVAPSCRPRLAGLMGISSRLLVHLSQASAGIQFCWAGYHHCLHHR